MMRARHNRAVEKRRVTHHDRQGLGQSTRPRPPVLRIGQHAHIMRTVSPMDASLEICRNVAWIASTKELA